MIACSTVVRTDSVVLKMLNNIDERTKPVKEKLLVYTGFTQFECIKKQSTTYWLVKSNTTFHHIW